MLCPKTCCTFKDILFLKAVRYITLVPWTMNQNMYISSVLIELFSHEEFRKSTSLKLKESIFILNIIEFINFFHHGVFLLFRWN